MFLPTPITKKRFSIYSYTEPRTALYGQLHIIKTNHKNLYTTSSEISGTIKPEYEGKIGSLMQQLLPAGSILGAPREEALRLILLRGVREEEVEVVRKQLPSETALLTENAAAASLANETARLLMAPNFFQNAKETERRRQQALGSVEPVRETIKKGQMLVRRGDVITPEHIQAMRESGLYHDTDMRKGQLAGLAIFAALILGLGTFFLYKFIPTVYQDHKRMLLLSLIVTGTLFLGKLAHLYSDYAAPLAAGVLLSTVLLGAKTGFMISVVLGALFGAGTRGARRMHQLARAVLVFDEVQTLPVKCAHLFNNAINFLAAQCNTTVAQYTARNSALRDLCRSHCWANHAPGQPPARLSRCRWLSLVRHWPFCAALLSMV